MLGATDLFPASPPERDVSREYRRWAFESAALDLALRQAGTNLAAAVGREPRPVNFVNSMRLGGFGGEERSSIEPLLARLAVYPTLRFKLDPTNDWDDELIAALAATGAVDSLDLKGFYKGTPVDVDTDPELYAKLIEAFPEAWLEDPDVTPETRPLLDPVSERVTWDAPIHSVADIEAMPWSPPKTVNVKPSRFGPIGNLFAAYDHCEERGIGAYGGGQTELGQGRGQIQYLASIFHPDTPNDVAPGGYNDPGQATKPGLPSSPLQPAIESSGSAGWPELDLFGRPNSGFGTSGATTKGAARWQRRASPQRSTRRSPTSSRPPSSTSAPPSTTTPRRCPGSPPSSTGRRWRSASTR